MVNDGLEEKRLRYYRFKKKEINIEGERIVDGIYYSACFISSLVTVNVGADVIMSVRVAQSQSYDDDVQTAFPLFSSYADFIAEPTALHSTYLFDQGTWCDVNHNQVCCGFHGDISSAIKKRTRINKTSYSSTKRNQKPVRTSQIS